MGKFKDLEINLEGMQESTQLVEKLLNEIIRNKNLTPREIREKARSCLEAVNRYTTVANRNVHLLNEQAQYLLKKVQMIQDDTLINEAEPDEDSEFDIN